MHRHGAPQEPDHVGVAERSDGHFGVVPGVAKEPCQQHRLIEGVAAARGKRPGRTAQHAGVGFVADVPRDPRGDRVDVLEREFEGDGDEVGARRTEIVAQRLSVRDQAVEVLCCTGKGRRRVVLRDREAQEGERDEHGTRRVHHAVDGTAAGVNGA